MFKINVYKDGFLIRMSIFRCKYSESFDKTIKKTEKFAFFMKNSWF